MVRHLSQEDFLKTENLPVNVLMRDPQVPFPLHNHDFAELVLVFSGTGIHFTTDDEYRLQAGDVFVIQGSQTHGYRDLNDLKLINIVYDFDRVGLPLEDLNDLPGYHFLFTLEPAYRSDHAFQTRLRLNPVQREEAERYCRRLAGERDQRGPAFRFALRIVFSELVLFLSRCWVPDSSPESIHLSRIADTITWMEKQAGRSITSGEILDVYGMSESSLLRAFKKTTGYSPKEYHTRLRIKKACELLQYGRYSITEIAWKTGFEDSNYFSRTFRKIMNSSPSEFRGFMKL